MQTIRADIALTPDGWQKDVAVTVGSDGRIRTVETVSDSAGGGHGILLPAPANLHSHAFQRAMAGLTEKRGPDPEDSFWTWRRLMYRFLDRLSPEDVGSIAAFAQMEMLEAGFAAVGEFHYLHHQADGSPYDRIAELAERHIDAAEATGIGLTLLPVLYERGGCDGRPLGSGQDRFGNDPVRFAELHAACRKAIDGSRAHFGLGIAPHSLRAVSPAGLEAAVGLAERAPIHIHIAEQAAEVAEVEAAYGRRPVERLFESLEIAGNWCLVHCTQMRPHETEMVAASGAVAGLCPVTEANLGDGIFDGSAYVAAGGRFGIGTDSNIRISLRDELAMLEYSQRLRDRRRAVLATPGKSAGRLLYEQAAAGGAQAIARDSGSIAPGRYADLVALDADTADLEGRDGDTVLDAFIFAGRGSMIRNVWSAGRHVVSEGRHVGREAIERSYRRTMRGLGQFNES